MSGINLSGIRDNHSRGNVGEFLKEKIQLGSKLAGEIGSASSVNIEPDTQIGSINEQCQ